MTPSWPTVRVHCSLLYGLVSPDSPYTLGHAGCVCECVEGGCSQNTHLDVLFFHPKHSSLGPRQVPERKGSQHFFSRVQTVTALPSYSAYTRLPSRYSLVACLSENGQSSESEVLTSAHHKQAGRSEAGHGYLVSLSYPHTSDTSRQSSGCEVQT